ncbi:MAG: AI-2E family transporter [Clostridiales bacterium]|nr:AI-2E family transporter [Clostridiales bacterium]
MNKKKILYIIILSLLLLIIFFFARKAVLTVLGLLIACTILSYIVLPFIKILEKRAPKTWATLIGFLLLIVILIAFFVLLVPVFVQQIKDLIVFLPQYVEMAKKYISFIFLKVPFLKEIFNNIKIDESISQKALNLINNFSPSTLITIASTALLVPVVMFYMIRDREQIKKIGMFLLPGKMRVHLMFTFRDINRQLRDYVMGEFIIILIVSGLMSVTLVLFGYEYWLILGLIMGIFNVIPYVGPIFGSIPILLTAATQGWNRVILALILIIVVQQIDNLIIQPRIISDSVKIHPVTVLICVLAGSAIGNFLGMVLAIPVYIILRILFIEFYKHFSERKQKIPEFYKL